MQFDISGSELFTDITVSDVTVYNPPLRGISVTVSGTLVLTRKDGTVKTVTVPAGGPFPFLGVTKVGASSTATGLVGYA